MAQPAFWPSWSPSWTLGHRGRGLVAWLSRSKISFTSSTGSTRLQAGGPLTSADGVQSPQATSRACGPLTAGAWATFGVVFYLFLLICLYGFHCFLFVFIMFYLFIRFCLFPDRVQTDCDTRSDILCASSFKNARRLTAIFMVVCLDVIAFCF